MVLGGKEASCSENGSGIGTLMARPGSIAKMSGYAEAIHDALKRAALAPIATGAALEFVQV